ncbi:MAG: hypothetical protein V3W34_19105 [Phycisphaerae bacterium]
MTRCLMVTIVAFTGSVAGCEFLPIGGPPPGTPPADIPPTPNPDNPADDIDEPAGGDGLPVAVAAPQFGDGPEVMLDGRAAALAFVEGSALTAPGGTIVTWEWLVDSRRVASGRQVAIGDFPVGVTTVTLVVTDDSGRQGTDAIDVINPGFRPGLWQGLTDQGHQVEFRITDEMTLAGFSFGFEFDGQNLLNPAPCIFVERRQECGSCTTSVESCAFTLTWGTNDEFSAGGNCVQDGLPPFEQATGRATAFPGGNCQGAADGITWTASWVSE